LVFRILAVLEWNEFRRNLSRDRQMRKQSKLNDLDLKTFRQLGLVLTVIILLGACANPAIDTSAANFDEDKYTDDLNTCRGGSATDVMLGGLGGALAGSLIGASEGASNGALAGASAEGAIIGVIVGGTIGIFVGAYKPFGDKHESVRQCLIGKGYALES
jgi:hypothetical protein